MFEILRNPIKSIVEDYILLWNGNETDFDTIMDALNDPNNRKDLGAFYMPLPYVKEVTKLVRKAIDNVSKGKYYIILDRCAGTGALEYYLTEEELSYVILNTYEIKEWLVLYNKYYWKSKSDYSDTFDYPVKSRKSSYRRGCCIRRIFNYSYGNGWKSCKRFAQSVCVII